MFVNNRYMFEYKATALLYDDAWYNISVQNQLTRYIPGNVVTVN